MTCCKANVYSWCSKLSVVDYKDQEGNEYCAFHAPRGKKAIGGISVSANDFNELIFDRISKTAKKGICNLSGTIFEDYIDFRRYQTDNPLPRLKLLSATFPERTSFFKVNFGGDVDFSGCIFYKDVSFIKAHFCGKAVFESVEFKDTAYFNETVFDDRTRFHTCVFENKAHFKFGHFGSEVDFTKTRFADEVNLRKIKFDGATQFNSVQFNNRTYFDEAEFGKMIIFFNSVFHDESYFRRIKGIETFWCVNTVFAKKVSFMGSSIQHGLFNGESFIDECQMRAVIIGGEIMLNNCDLGKVSFFGTDLRKFSFVNCCWSRGHRDGGRPILYDERLLFPLKKIYPMTLSPFILLVRKVKDYFAPINKNLAEQLELQYRMLKQKHKEDHDEPEASCWHYNEKNIFRISSPLRRYLPSLTTLYWLSSGYGERPVRAGVVLVLLLSTFSICFVFFGGLEMAATLSDLQKQEYAAGPSIKKFLITFINNVRFATFQKDTPLTPNNLMGESMKTLMQLIIPAQFTLFVVAIRNRFRR